MKAGGAERGPDLEGLRAFVREGDRNRARFFVGREAQIRDIEQVCADAMAEYRAGGKLAGATRLIQGAPGAGKTALLEHLDGLFGSPKEPDGLLSRLFRREPQGPPLPKTLLLSRGALANLPGVAVQIAECLDAGRARQWRQTHSRAVSMQVGAPGMASAGSSETVATAPSSPSFAELRRIFPPQDWKRPICLMVDEIQNLEREEAATLEALHLGTAGLPVVPVLAGLANSREVLARCGISRLNEDGVHTLGRLEAGEPAEAVRRMLDAYRADIAGADAGRWAERLEKHSDRWPQHLQNAMRSLAEELVEAKGALAEVDEAAVFARARDRRLAAYRARRSPAMQEAVFLLARIMAGVPESGLRRNEAVGSIGDLAKSEGDCGWRLPEGMSPTEFLDHLVHRGALQSGEDDRLVCPIPSFRRFLIEEGARVFRDDWKGLPMSGHDEADVVALLDEAAGELDDGHYGPQSSQ